MEPIECFTIPRSRMISAWLIFLVLDIILDVSESQRQDSKPLEHLLAYGQAAMTNGRKQDALTYYHEAVEKAPENYMVRFHRATTYHALGKPNMVIADLEKALEIKPDFLLAKIQLIKVLIKMGKLSEARQKWDTLTGEDLMDREIQTLSQLIDNLQHEILLAEAYLRGEDYSAAVESFGNLIKECPWSYQLREKRANTYMLLGDKNQAIMDIRSATRLQTDNAAGYLRLSQLLYEKGDTEESLKEIRECLKLDPEHKECFPFYKRVKKVHKLMTDMRDEIQAGQFSDCIKDGEKVLSEEKDKTEVRFSAYQGLCKCYQKTNDVSKGVDSCSEALKIREDAEVYCDRAEAYVAGRMFESAIHDYQHALELDDSLSRAKEGLQRAKKMQKQAEKRDYYQILEVSPNASKEEIMKAYRKKAAKYHPDNQIHKTQFERDRARKIFIDVAAAKEVLTDPEKRQQFDHGEDPLDPESGSHPSGFNPFQRFHTFHDSGPFQFRFQFR